MNTDIRLPSRTNRPVAFVTAIAIVAFSMAFALSFVPSSASAAFFWNPWHHQQNPTDTHYTECHNHEDDNNNGGIDLMDSGCDDVDNTPPVAGNQTLITNQDAATSTVLTATDDDEDLLYFATTNPSHGTLSGTLPDVTYTPDAGWSGTDSFTFTVNDGRPADNSTGTITITVVATGPQAPACDGSTTFDSFTLGSVNGQGGWTISGPYDQAVVSNTYGFSTFGCQTLRISNSVTSGSFGDQLFSPSTANEAGETSAQTSALSGGTRQNHFEAQFDVASAVPAAQQPGLIMAVSPDRGDGARMAYVRFEDQADGIHVFTQDYIDAAPMGTLEDPAPGCGDEDDWNNIDIATLDRTAPHTIKLTIDFVDGAGNDVYKVYVDGALKHTGTTWEDYYRWCTESGGGVANDATADVSRTVDSLLFRESSTAVPANAGKGFLVDNVSLSTGATPVVDPTCVSGQHLENHVCVADANGNGGGSSNTNTGNGGGGGGTVVGLIGSVNTNPTGNTSGGQVLGASTDLPAGCSIYFDGYVKKGSTNTELIKKLQTFLNSNLGLSIPITGVFGQMTLDAVNKFQVKYADEILKPWFDKGLSKDMNPSGYVYKTTARMINLLSCSSLEIPVPQLP
ncbi:MAG TPA: Ig-like domain-containing protein [Candidatus Paceibacterota bacterium]|nr:Ig-like domain-containing protein [Candidatus Paceibacterota bacterium]